MSPELGTKSGDARKGLYSKQINDDPGKQLDMGTASAETRHRSTKLYSLLASLVRNRALSVVRATPNSDGYEALRQLILNLKPNTQTRGLALLSAITSYPSFNMQKPLLSQLIKLEEMFEETRKSGTPVQEELKVAILIKCITGPLKTQLNLILDGSAKYSDVFFRPTPSWLPPGRSIRSIALQKS